MSRTPTFQFRKLLERLVQHDVEFVIVGGLAGVLHGSPINTQDLGIVYEISEANIHNLLRALSSLDAVFRADPRRIAPNASHLASRGHKLLETCFGPLDCLATIEENTAYEDLVEHMDPVDLDGLVVQVASGADWELCSTARILPFGFLNARASLLGAIPRRTAPGSRNCDKWRKAWYAGVV